MITFEVPSLTAGQYSVEINTINSNDINPSNNTLTTEIEVIDETQPSIIMSYATQNAPDGQVSWNGGGTSGDGVAVHMVPPVFPVTLESVEMYIAQGANDIANQGGYTIEVLADDGVNNSPGTLLATEVVAQGSYTPSSWVSTTLSSPLILSSGGIYIAWKMGGDSLAMGTETTGPISRQTYEYLGGSYSSYRNSTVEDFLINGVFKDFPVGIDEMTLENNLNEIKIYPNPTQGIFMVDASNSKENVNIKVFNTLGQEITNKTIVNGQKSSIDISGVNRGVYLIQLKSASENRTERLMVY